MVESERTSERTPLVSKDDLPRTAGPTPLPTGQIVLLSITRLAEPLGFSVLFPFINAMVMNTGVEAAEVGYLVGWIESLFSLTSALFLFAWARAADKYGRRPILLITLFFSGCSCIGFGFSKTIWQMLLFRGLNGCFAGSTVVIRTLFAENSDATNQARAFSFYAFASNLGLLLGPTLGGLLAEPFTRYPGSLGRLPLTKAYPYALPCLVAGLAIISADLACFFLLREPAKKEVKGDTKSTIKSLMNLDILGIFVAIFFSSTLGFLFTALMPLFAFTPTELGGLSFNPQQIGILISLVGFFQAIWLLVIMPPADRKFGTRKLLQLCFLFWPLSFLLPMGAHLAAKRNAIVLEDVLLLLCTALASGVAIAFTSTQLILNKFTPPPALATANAANLTLQALLRTVCPAAVTSLFAVGVENHIPFLAWYLLLAISALAMVFSYMLPRERKEEKAQLE